MGDPRMMLSCTFLLFSSLFFAPIQSLPVRSSFCCLFGCSFLGGLMGFLPLPASFLSVFSCKYLCSAPNDPPPRTSTPEAHESASHPSNGHLCGWKSIGRDDCASAALHLLFFLCRFSRCRAVAAHVCAVDGCVSISESVGFGVIDDRFLAY